MQLKRGLFEICVLAAIRDEDSYGYRIIKTIKPYIDISESTLYPILRRLEAAGFISVRSSEHNGRLRKYYHINQAGKERFALSLRSGAKSARSINLSQGRNPKMSKTEFMNDLSQKLDKLTQADREEYMSFFSELIDDKIEEGYAEMSALESLGDAEELAQTILTSVPVTLNPKTEYIENHTVIDCTNRYRDGENLFRFTIKTPRDTDLHDVIIEITRDYRGTVLFCTNLK